MKKTSDDFSPAGDRISAAGSSVSEISQPRFVNPFIV